jgi:hypothetical protein
MKTSELAGISRDFRGQLAEFLCTSDCVAEGEGLELSVRFCDGKPRHVRKMQIAKPYQRISHQTRRQGFAISPISLRRPFEPEGERQAILWLKVGS